MSNGKLMKSGDLREVRSDIDLGIAATATKQLMSHIDALQALLNEAAPEGAPTTYKAALSNAAPELLAALGEWLPYVEETALHLQYTNEKRPEEVMVRARIAIAKAKAKDDEDEECLVRHTKAPWMAILSPAVNRHARVESDDGKLVCDVGNMEIDSEDRWDADARLIVAAPEMLAALESVVPYLNTLVVYVDQERVRRQIFEAIAKAKGE